MCSRRERAAAHLDDVPPVLVMVDTRPKAHGFEGGVDVLRLQIGLGLGRLAAVRVLAFLGGPARGSAKGGSLLEPGGHLHCGDAFGRRRVAVSPSVSELGEPGTRPSWSNRLLGPAEEAQVGHPAGMALVAGPFSVALWPTPLSSAIGRSTPRRSSARGPRHLLLAPLALEARGHDPPALVLLLRHRAGRPHCRRGSHCRPARDTRRDL